MSTRTTQPTLRMWRFFVKAIELGSISATAQFFSTDASFVSHELKNLDLIVGEALLERTKRGVKPTWSGVMRYKEAKDVVNLADRIFTFKKITLSNEIIRIAVPTSLATLFIQWATEFDVSVKKKCSVEIEQYNANATIDIVNYDYVICEDALPNARVIAKQLGFVRRVIVASSDFLKVQHKIKLPEELEKEKLIAVKVGRYLMNGKGESIAIWVEPKVRINASSNLAAAAFANAGYAVGVPLWQIQRELKLGTLKNVLPDWELVARPVWILRHPKKDYSPEAKQLATFFAECWLKTPGLSRCA